MFPAPPRPKDYKEMVSVGFTTQQRGPYEDVGGHGRIRLHF
jgi:hypothetical protein